MANNNQFESVPDDPDVPLGGSEREGVKDQPSTAEVAKDPTKDPTPPAQPKEVKRAELVTPEEKVQQAQLSALEAQARLMPQLMADRKKAAEEQAKANQKMQALLSEPLPQMPSFEQIYGNVQPKPPPTQNQLGLYQAVGSYAAIAIALAYAFGARRGPARWGAMRGIGEGMKSIAAGYKDRADEAMKLWKEQNDLAISLADRQLAYQKDIINLKNMTLDHKKEVLQYMNSYWGNIVNSDKLQMDDWDGYIGNLSKQEKILGDMKQHRMDQETRIMNGIGGGAVQQAYNEELLRRFPRLKALHDQPESDRDVAEFQREYNKDNEIYPFSQFNKEHPSATDIAQRKEAETRRFPTTRDKEYLSVLINKFPKLRKGLQSPADSPEFDQAFEQASKDYSRQQFDIEHPARAQDQPPAELRTGASPTASPTPGKTSVDPGDQQTIDALGEKFFGGKK